MANQQLRFELIGSADDLISSFSEASSAAQGVEENLEGLEQAARQAALGQLEYNEAAGQFVNEAGDFISQAEAAGRAQARLNEVGIETTAQIRDQIQEFEALKAAYQDDDRAVADLNDRQQQLRNQLAEVGEAAAQQNRDLSRLDQEFSEATVAMADFSKRQERLQQELRATAAAQDRVASSGVVMRSSVQASANNLGFEFVQAAQDAQFGAQAVANQLPLMAEQFSQLQSKTGSTTGALFALRGSLLGPAGIIGAITLGLPLVQQLTSSLFEAGKEAESFSDQMDSAADSVFRLRDATQDPIRLGLEQARQSVELLSDDLNELREIRERLLSPSSPEFAAAAGAVGTPSGSKLEPRPTEALEALRERETISENTQNRLDEIIQQRKDLNTLLQVQRRTLAEGSEITKAQVQQIQEGTASTEALVTASEEGVVRFERLSGLADDLLGRYQSVNQLLRGQNRLVDQNLVTQEQVTEELASRLEDAENIEQVQQRLNSAVEDGLITREQMQAVMEDLQDETEDEATALEKAREEADKLQQRLGELLGPQGIALAQARRTKEQYQRQAEALRNINRILARRESGIQAEKADPASQSTRSGSLEGFNQQGQTPMEAAGELPGFVSPALFEATTRRLQTINQKLQQLQDTAEAAAGTPGFFESLFNSTEEIQDEFEVGEKEARQFRQGALQQIAAVTRGVERLGKSLERAFEDGELSAREFGETVLPLVGTIVGALAGGPVGSRIGGSLGSLAGSVIPTGAEGGLVRGPGGPTDDQVPAWLSHREFVMQAESAKQAPAALRAMNDNPAVAQMVERMVAGQAGLKKSATTSNAPMIVHDG